jgi:hypothetical protein
VRRPRSRRPGRSRRDSLQDARHHGDEVGAFRRAQEPDDLDALELRFLPEILGDPLPPGGRIGDDEGTADAALLGELSAHGTLYIVPATDPVHLGVAAVRNIGIGVGRGEVAQVGAVVDLGGGDLDAGIIVAHHSQDRRIGHDGLRVGDALLGGGLVVEGHELHLDAHLREGTGQLFDGELRGILDVDAGVLGVARQGTLGGDLDHLLLLAAHEEQTGGRQDGCGNGSEFPHERSSEEWVARHRVCLDRLGIGEKPNISSIVQYRWDIT